MTLTTTTVTVAGNTFEPGVIIDGNHMTVERFNTEIARFAANTLDTKEATNLAREAEAFLHDMIADGTNDDAVGIAADALNEIGDEAIGLLNGATDSDTFAWGIHESMLMLTDWDEA